MSILAKKRTTESYLEKIASVLPEKSWESVRGAIRNFIRFVFRKNEFLNFQKQLLYDTKNLSAENLVLFTYLAALLSYPLFSGI